MQNKLNVVLMLFLPSLPRIAGAGTLALLMTLLVGNAAFAKEGTRIARGLPSSATVQASDASVDAGKGVVIVAVDPDGPAAEAGIERGDILLAAGDVEINSMVALFAVVTAAEPGDALELSVLHGDESRSISVTLSEQGGTGQGGHTYLGVQVVEPLPVGTVEALRMPGENAAPGLANDINHNESNEVVAPTVVTATEFIRMPVPLLVAEVVAEGPAAAAGVAAGDLILQIDETPVRQAADLVDALGGYAPADKVTLMVQRGGWVGAAILQIPVILGAAPDDATQAYLGIRVTAMTRAVAANMASPTDHSAPPATAVPALPMMPGAIHPGPNAGCTYGSLHGAPQFYPPAPFFIYHRVDRREGTDEVRPYAVQGHTVPLHAVPPHAVPPHAVPPHAIEVGTSQGTAAQHVIVLQTQDGARAETITLMPPTQGRVWAATVPGVAFSEAVAATDGATATFRITPGRGVVEIVPHAPVIGGSVVPGTSLDLQMPVPVDEWL